MVDAQVGLQRGLGAQARKRMPPTCSPAVPVERSGTARPFTSTSKRSVSSPSARTSTRSIDESTNRDVPPAPGSSPITGQGSSALRTSTATPPTWSLPTTGQRNSTKGR